MNILNDDDEPVNDKSGRKPDKKSGINEKEEKEAERKTFVIDLNDAPDKLESTWWNKLDPVHFEFTFRIPLLQRCIVKDGDILIQKYKSETERFFQYLYYYIQDGKMLLMGNKNNSIKPFIVEGLMNYVFKYKKLPNKCSFVKAFNNGNVQIDYTPGKFDNYALTVGKKRGLSLGIEDLDEYFRGMTVDESKQIEYVPRKVDKDNILTTISGAKNKKRQKDLIEDTSIDTHSKKIDARERMDTVEKPKIDNISEPTEENSEIIYFDAEKKKEKKDRSDEPTSDEDRPDINVRDYY